MSSGYFIFDKNKCVGCQACVVACMNENGFQENQAWRHIFTNNQAKTPGIPLFHISLACNHCDEAPCMKYCPALAYTRSVFTGAVLHEADHCIGCQYCVWQCPYEAPKFNPSNGIVEKCHFCESRQKENQVPACAHLCPANALDFSFEVIDKAQISPSIPIALNPKPSLTITELYDPNGPEMDSKLFEKEELVIEQKKDKEIGANQEWPLLIFTFFIAVLVTLSAIGVNKDSADWIKWGMTISGAFGAMISTLHLGKKLRMWRALLNLKYSWLSREIFFFSIYYILMLIDFYVMDLNYYVMLIPGALTLFSIDMLYTPVQQKWKVPFHSGQTIFITISLLLLFHHDYILLLTVLLLRFALDIYNFISFEESLKKYPLFLIRWSMIDIGIILFIIGTPFWSLLLCIGLGEFLGRILFYENLEIEKIEL